MSLVNDLLPHMRRVLAAERDLHDLTLLWQLIEASSAISCPQESASILPTLSETRVRFKDLQDRLVTQLASENLAELGDELASVGQCTIDILVRNLFERTADVGFLATDDNLRDFCALDDGGRSKALPQVRRRLGEYRDKYTVYDDLIVLDPSGKVLVRLRDDGVQRTGDPVVGQALGHEGHVERYARSDLADGGGTALLYAHRIVDAAHRQVGVLVLRFRVEDELARIFTSVSAEREGVAVVLVDAHGRVVVSNDETHVPRGATVKTGRDGQVEVTTFAGREYLSVTCETRGYQGYMGPGWRAHAMVSLLTAFRGGHDDAAAADDAQVKLDNAELQAIQTEVDAINRNLRRVVWNGRLKAGADGQDDAGNQDRLKAVLHQVNQAGFRTRERVAVAIGDLYRTSLGRARHQAHELARLAADIMDRNLYERANDCRWWALSPVLRRELVAPKSTAGSEAMNRVLGAINALYTVYTRLVVFDMAGCIRGVSNDDPQDSLIGKTVDPAYVQAVSGLSDSQRYAVSDFAPSPLYDGRHTYVYLAAVRDDGGRISGGIAIVFNAEHEFRAMLSDVLDGRDGWSAFVDRSGRVVASTNPALAVGTILPTDVVTDIVEFDGSHFAQAAVPTAGYREFKQQDGYSNGVTAIVSLRLGAVERRKQQTEDATLEPLPTQQPNTRQEMALFQVAAGRFALASEWVREACPPQGVMRLASASPAVTGMMNVPGVRGSQVVPVVSARRLLGVDTPPRASDGVVLVIEPPGGGRPAFGLLVDQVLSVIEVGPEHVQPVAGGLRAGAPALAALVRVSSRQREDVMVQLLDAAVLGASVGLAGVTATAHVDP